jgi:hypothetical protein
MRDLDQSNKIVHGMWVGNTLSKLELLTIHSFLDHGHEFHLWAYSKIRTTLPREVVIQDATEIIPNAGIFKKRDTDTETGVGKGSLGAPFSDIFRFKLLYEKGGYWVDMDVTCLKPFNFSDEYVFRTHRIGVVGNIMKCPPKSEIMWRAFETTSRLADENAEWLLGNRILTENVNRLGLARYIRNDVCSEDSWWHVVKPFIEEDRPVPDHLHAIHWINEFWRTLRVEGGIYRGRKLLDYIPDKDNVKPGTTLARLYGRYNL